jgi:hypothetical protein
MEREVSPQRRGDAEEGGFEKKLSALRLCASAANPSRLQSSGEWAHGEAFGAPEPGTKFRHVVLARIIHVRGEVGRG